MQQNQTDQLLTVFVSIQVDMTEKLHLKAGRNATPNNYLYQELHTFPCPTVNAWHTCTYTECTRERERETNSQLLPQSHFCNKCKPSLLFFSFHFSYFFFFFCGLAKQRGIALIKYKLDTFRSAKDLKLTLFVEHLFQKDNIPDINPNL